MAKKTENIVGKTVALKASVKRLAGTFPPGMKFKVTKQSRHYVDLESGDVHLTEVPVSKTTPVA